MCVFLQNRKWWYEFTISGHRIRKSSGSTERDIATLIEAEHRRSLELGTGGISSTREEIKAKEKANRPSVEISSILPGVPSTPQAAINRKMGLLQATEILLAQKVMRRLKPKSIESTQGQVNALVRFFGDIPLNEITAESFIAYQTNRAKAVCPETVNHECAILKKVLKKAIVVQDGIPTTLWEPIAEYYSPLRPREWKPPKTFTVQEQQRIFDHAANDPNLELAQIVFTITRNTTASGCELRGLRLKHLELDADPPRIHVPHDSTKNDIRPRVIPLNDQALRAFRKAILRAAKLGSHRPEHYLFPFRLNRAFWNPNKPASPSWLRKQTARLRKDSGIPHLRPHAFRHLAVTELLEQGAPEQTVIALAGWVGRKMIETYSHPRIEAKAEIVKLLEQTGHKAPERSTPTPQLPPDLMHPAIQAEIARQVALALQQLNLAPSPQTQPVANGLRLIAFPGVAARPNGGSL